MPRAHDSDQTARGEAPVQVVENVECMHCPRVLEVVFVVPGNTIEDLDELPTANVVCPCGARFTASMTGWTHYTEAG